ncbi:phage tail protein [Salmonella enterica]|nr:phage tail protein [Salmonella enterica]
MATTILISGVLMDGTGNPIPDCDITLTALRTSRSVVAKTSGLGATSSAGEYSLTVPPGDYRVTLCIDGYPPAEPGMIHVYADSTPGTLNDFLLAPGESDLTPDILKQLEELAKAAKASADAAAGSAAASAASADGAAKSASDAGNAAGEAQKYRDEAKEFADHLDVKDASTSQKGIVQLSSATDSDSETVAATPKAVKAAMDNANGRLEKNSNGGDIPDKKQFARTIGAVTSTTITLGESGWYKIATVVMPQSTSTAVIKLYGSSGYNVGSFEQGAISELVLRAGNGSPVGITATLWRRSPAAANEVAWVNTSGDTYDIYINIGQYAYWLIAQYDYTSNANVTLYSTPEYSSVQPGNSTSGQTYTIYSSLMKPTAGNVGALPITGGRLNGPLGIGTDNALGGNSIVLGDNDTGFKQDGDGILGIYANNARVGYIDNSGLHMSVDVLTNGAVRAGNAKKLSLTSNNNSALNAGFNLWGDGGNRPTVIELGDDQGWHLYSQRNPDGSIQFCTSGQIVPGNWGNFDTRYQPKGSYTPAGQAYTKGESDARYLQNIQRGAPVSPGKIDEYGPAEAPAGCVLTNARHDPGTKYGVFTTYRPLQMWIGNGWRTING